MRVAHGYGNRRFLISRALEAGADLIEADLRYDRGEVWVRHERRLGLLPVLYNYRMPRAHRHGPFSTTIGPWFLRLDVRPIRLAELVRLVGGRTGLLLDLKAGRYSPRDSMKFVRRVLRGLDEGCFSGRIEFCGSWTLLDALRTISPDAILRYSVDSPDQWTAIEPRLQSGEVRAISIRFDMTEARADLLRKLNVNFYCWAVYSGDEAVRAVELGASGVIAGLDVLRALQPAAARRQTT